MLLPGFVRTEWSEIYSNQFDWTGFSVAMMADCPRFELS